MYISMFIEILLVEAQTENKLISMNREMVEKIMTYPTVEHYATIKGNHSLGCNFSLEISPRSG